MSAASSFSGFSESSSTTPTTASIFTTTSALKRKSTWSWVYIEADSKRPRTSFIWKHGIPVKRSNDESHTLYWCCGFPNCHHKPFKATATTSARDHLKTQHHIEEGEATTQALSVIDQQKQGKQQQSDQLYTLSFIQVLLRFIVSADLPFRTVTNTYFQRLLTWQNAAIAKEYPSSGNGLKNELLKAYKAKKKDIRALLRSAKSQIHLSFDVWSSPNGYALNGICAHFLAADFTLQTILLGLCYLQYQHTGERIGQAVIELCRDYEIEEALETFVLDNAGNNDTAVAYIVRTLGMDIRPEYARLRCCGHIINLAAQDFLFPTPRTPGDPIEQIGFLNTFEQDLQRWITQGSIGHLQKVVKLIALSPQRSEDFKRLVKNDPLIVKELFVVRDNKTRWNSTFNMIDRAIYLQYPLDTYLHNCLTDRSDTVVTPEKWTPFSNEDWGFIKEAHQALKPFHAATKFVEGATKNGYHGALWECLPIIGFLYNEMTQLAARQDVHPNIRYAAKSAVAKLVKYWHITEASPYNLIAIVLNPLHKWSFVEQQWVNEPGRLQLAKQKVQNLWERHQRKHQITQARPVPEAPAAPQAPTHYDPINEYLAHFEAPLAVTGPEDEFKTWLALPRERVSNLIAYWRTQELRFPVLTKLAYNIISIPAMSSACERVFSLTKLQLPPHRNRLKPCTVNAAACLKNWWAKEATAPPSMDDDDNEALWDALLGAAE